MLGNVNTRPGKWRLGAVNVAPQIVETVSNTLLLTQSLNIRRDFSVTQTLSLAQTLDYVKSRKLVSTLLFSQNLTSQLSRKQIIYNGLLIFQNLSFTAIYNRTLSNILTFLPTRTVQITPVGDTFEAPNLIANKVARHTIFVTQTRQIVLPNPLFGDSEANKVKTSILRTISGELYAYTRKGISNRLKYTFELGRKKGLELRDFLDINRSALIGIYNWKGEAWVVKLVTNPIVFETTGRYSPDREAVRVSLEFEGQRIG